VLRTHRCGELRKKHVGKKVKLCGWIHAMRVMGKKIFIDLRDRYGIVQLVLDERFKSVVEKLRRESVILVSGKVVERKEPNPKLETGEVEVVVESLAVLSRAEPLPLEIFNPEIKTTEETRLRYRYLDLRRPEMQKILEFRFKAEMIVRNYLAMHDFIEIETPYLSKPTPEGARDFLVPSRTFRGKFWALPQSPQLYKQLLMVAGFDRYFQIARCFRDEDLRKDRQYEFTQIDIEMSFADEEDVMKISEGLIATLYAQLLGIELKRPFPRIKWKEAMDRYGSDKPDLRFGLELKDFTEFFGKSGFKIFDNIVSEGGVVKGIVVKELLSKKVLREADKIAKAHEFPGIAWIKREERYYGPIASALPRSILEEILEENSTAFLLAGEWLKVCEALGDIRNLVGEGLGLRKGLSVVWVTDFPLFEWSEEKRRIQAAHHPFTMPQKGYEEKLFEKLTEKELLEIPARAYDLVINGVEIGGGSVRITDTRLQERVFEILGISRDEAWKKFGMLLEAFRYGVPPHAGIAFGLDRLLQVMLGKETIRDVIAFPKSKSGKALMEDAPSEADEELLKELGIKIEVPRE